jgi:excisionase family DNA binding protein
LKKEVLTIPQAAEYCAVSRVTLWKYVKSGDLKASLTPGGHHRIMKKDLERFIFEKGMAPLTKSISSNNRILVVDDEPSIQRVLSQMLSKQAYETEAASDGFEAGIKLVKFKPSLVVLDLFMPGMDGFEVCKRIKENPDTSHVKVLAITGYHTRKNKDRIMKAGADDYLTKPLKKEVFLQHVADCLSHGLGD